MLLSRARLRDGRIAGGALRRGCSDQALTRCLEACHAGPAARPSVKRSKQGKVKKIIATMPYQ